MSQNCQVWGNPWVMVESSNKTWYTGEGSGKPFRYYCLENNKIVLPLKRQIDMNYKMSPPGQ